LWAYFAAFVAQHSTSTIIAGFSFATRMDFTGDIFNLQGLNKVRKPHLLKFDIPLVFYIVLSILSSFSQFSNFGSAY
jgi:hypothetical protein